MCERPPNAIQDASAGLPRQRAALAMTCQLFVEWQAEVLFAFRAAVNRPRKLHEFSTSQNTSKQSAYEARYRIWCASGHAFNCRDHSDGHRNGEQLPDLAESYEVKSNRSWILVGSTRTRRVVPCTRPSFRVQKVQYPAPVRRGAAGRTWQCSFQAGFVHYPLSYKDTLH